MNELKKKIGFMIMLLSLMFFSLTNASAEELTITGNGGGSQNEVNITSQTTTTIKQTNQAQVVNDVKPTANSGDNQTSGNTGNSNITTGNIDSKTTVENQGNVSKADNPCCPSPGTTVTISGNGENSQNSVSVANGNQTNVDINQKAEIKNEITGQASTGGNQANDNSGNVSINTGNITAQENIDNHNINVADVIAGQAETDIAVKISDNGSWSTNTVSTEEQNQTNIQIDNEASIENHVNWDLSTGNNFGSGNLGDTAIVTGNINFDLNIENGPINLSEVMISCCPTPKPAPTPTPSPSPSPTPSPTPTPSEDGGDGGRGGSTSGSGSSGGESAGVGGLAAGEVLGAATGEVLAETGSNWLIFLTLFSIAALAGGLYLRFHPQPQITTKHLRLVS